MKKTPHINNLTDLENELSELHAQSKANQSAMQQQLKTAKGDFIRLLWSSVKNACGNSFNAGNTNPLNDLTQRAFRSVLKWARRKFT